MVFSLQCRPLLCEHLSQCCIQFFVGISSFVKRLLHRGWWVHAQHFVLVFLLATRYPQLRLSCLVKVNTTPSLIFNQWVPGEPARCSGRGASFLQYSEPGFVNLLRSPVIDSQPGGQKGTSILFDVLARLATQAGGTDSLESIPGLFKGLQIRDLQPNS